MPKYKIADFIVEYNPKYDNLNELSKPFIYNGDEQALITISRTDKYIENLLARMEKGTTIAQTEEFAYASCFNKAVIPYGAMLIHSSAILVKGKAYLFSAKSGIGKSTHTRLWKQLYGDEVTYINDDKPVVRIENGFATAYGTPFDGGSGIANNISAPLGGIIFLERGEKNKIFQIESTSQILQNLYFSTLHMLNKDMAFSMIDNFEQLINTTKFYKMSCNMKPEAARVAHDFLIK